MTAFREPCYWGETAGAEVYFSPTEESVLGVAGIYSAWSPPDAETPVMAMALVMRPALPYVDQHGHHQTPFILHREGYDKWMAPEKRKPFASLSVLREFACEPQLIHHLACSMAPSWTSRRKQNESKRDEQHAANERIGALGF